MSKVCLNNEILFENNKRFIIDKTFLDDVRYFIKRKCNMEKFDRKIEKRRKGELYSDSPESVRSYINYFLNNYENTYNISHDKVSFEDMVCVNEMLNYLLRTYPYCLFPNDEVMTKNIDSALLYFAQNNLSTQASQMPYIIPVLKTINMHHVDYTYTGELWDTNLVCYSDICGTTNDNYKQDTLYDVLVAMGNECVNKSINYIMKNDCLFRPGNIIRCNPVSFVQYGNYLCVKDSVELLMVARALQEITHMVTLNSFNNNPLFYTKIYKKTP